MDCPTITVIVPTYNDGEMLQEALRSVLRQTFDDYEVIVGDDCSTNKTGELAEAFCRQDPRFRVIRYPNNVGMTDNWNRLASEARGEFICKLDGDDAYQPDYLSKLYAALHEHHAGIAFCRTIDCDQHLMPVSSYYGERAWILNGIDPLQDTQKPGGQWYELSFDGYQLWHSNAFLIKRSIFQELRGWDNRWGCVADTDLILRLLERDEKVCCTAYPGVLYRRRQGSVLSTFRERKWQRLESSLVLGMSLGRMHTKGFPLSSRLRRSWVRIWNTYQTEQIRLQQNPDEFEGLKARDVRISPPPFLQRIEEGAYKLASSVKRKCAMTIGSTR